MNQLGSTDLKRLHRDWRRRSTARLSVALDGVQGPFNVGGIIRTAAAYRAEHLWLTATSTGPDNPKVAKTALGTDRYLTVETEPTMLECAAKAHDRGFRVVGIELAAGALAALVLGGDEPGFAQKIVKAAATGERCRGDDGPAHLAP